MISVYGLFQIMNIKTHNHGKWLFLLLRTQNRTPTAEIYTAYYSA